MNSLEEIKKKLLDDFDNTFSWSDIIPDGIKRDEIRLFIEKIIDTTSKETYEAIKEDKITAARASWRGMGILEQHGYNLAIRELEDNFNKWSK